MSCSNCYSASRNKLNETMINKILERGQRLRNAMVETIVNNDPFYADSVCNRSNSNKAVKLADLPDEESVKIKAFLQGDHMTRKDEVLALDTLRAMSAPDLCTITDRTYKSSTTCGCPTCRDYSEKNLDCDLKRTQDPPLNIPNEATKLIRENYELEASEFLKYVDSLKISTNTVALNENGAKKVMENINNDRISNISQTYFLEYEIPAELSHHQQKGPKSRVNSGLVSGNVVRLCSRANHNLGINFKQVSIHDVPNLTNRDLNDMNLIIRLSFRNFRQKKALSLGCAQFDFASFKLSKHLSCHQELPIKLHDNSIVMGVVRISLQLGCGRLYFGKEFIDALSKRKDNLVVLDSNDLSEASESTEPEIEALEIRSSSRKQKPEIDSTSSFTQHSEMQSSRHPQQIIQKFVLKSTSQQTEPENFQPKSDRVAKSQNIITIESPLISIQEPSKTILFGFVYISQAQFVREVLNSYLSCSMFGQHEICYKKSLGFTSNPSYNFHEQIPLLYDEEFVQNLRENFILVKFLEKNHQKDFLTGITKLSLHQFYLNYRNLAITQYLTERKFPVISAEGWEPITHPSTDEIVGHVQILLALGTREQIDNLELDRGFRKKIIANNHTPIFEKPTKDTKVDVAIQSEMDPNKNIEALLSQLVTNKQSQPNLVNTSTNTDTPQKKSTSDLLDSLEKVFNTEEKTTFKAQIAINEASHLPSRKKCKARKSKGRSPKPEDSLPSTYVTFEGAKGDLKMTPIIPKSTTPKWEYRTEVILPLEYLTNCQKFMVFKVWRKSTNTTMTPNLETDVVIGFATVDLSALLAGLTSIQGWYNINDLSKKCNGQINIHVTPLENLSRYQNQRSSTCSSPEAPLVAIDEPGELLGRALKRKFTELDEITQRLRLRLSKVTNDECDTTNDEVADEFERDINTLCIEEDFNMINFEDSSSSTSLNRREVGLLSANIGLERNLFDGKQKIDTLLEKLSLLSESNSRYVSGCSGIDTEAILCELDHTSRPNIHTSVSFDKDMSDKFGSGSSESRQVPEGEGIEEDTD